MEEIISVNNNLVKETAKLLQKKYRDSEDKFLLEGFKAIEEAYNLGLQIDYIFVNSSKLEKYNFFNGKIYSTNEIVLKKISDASSAPEAIGVAKQKHGKKNDFKNLNKVILLEGIKDLGNLGTIIRTAAAFGIDGIVLFGECADLYNPKCVRSAVGNLWKIPILKTSELSDLKELFNNYQRVATLPLAKTFLKDFKPKEKCLMMFGSEADGLSQDLINFSTEAVKIEMKDNVESLNLAISAGVVMYKMMV